MPITSSDNFTSFAPEQQLELFIPSYLDASADLDALHRPVTNDGRPWFPYTQDHFMTELKLTPCARLLWKWILLKGPAGSCVEIDLGDFRAVTAEHRRGKPYCMKQIRKAVGELEALQLIVIRNERLKVQARHPGKVTNLNRSKPERNLGSKPENLSSKPGNLSSTPENLSSTPKPEMPTTEGFQKLSDLTYLTDLSKSAAAAAANAAAAAADLSEKNEVAATLPQENEVVATPPQARPVPATPPRGIVMPATPRPTSSESDSLLDATKNCSVSEMARVESKPVASFSLAETSPESAVAYHCVKGDYQRAAIVAGLYKVDYWAVIDQLGLANDDRAYVMARRRT